MMSVAVSGRAEGVAVPSPVKAVEAAALEAGDVLARLGSGTGGLAEAEAARRLRVTGPNAVRSHRVRALSVLASPSLPLTLAALAVVTVGAVLPYTGRLAHLLGFRPLPGPFFLFLIVAIVSYLALIEVGKHWFYRSYPAPAAPAPRHRRRGYRVRRRAARFTTRTLRPARRPGSSRPARQPSPSKGVL